MAKEWILNSMMNRYRLNIKTSVGATSKSIRGCEPKGKEAWSSYYFFDKVKSKEYITI